MIDGRFVDLHHGLDNDCDDALDEDFGVGTGARSAPAGLTNRACGAFWRNRARPVDQRQDEDFALSHSIDESVPVHEERSDLRIAEFRNDASALAECG